MNLNPFHYEYYSIRFRERLLSKIENGLSSILLGPRNIGKKYILDQIIEELLRKSPRPIGFVRFLESGFPGDNRNSTPSKDEAEDFVDLLPCDHETIMNWIDANSQDYSPLLIATNVDNLRDQQAEQFLRSIRIRVEGKGSGKNRLIAILTGELDLTQLVHGPDSIFNCANQYVLQGFDRETFETFHKHYTKALKLPGLCKKEVIDQLHIRTGGNIYFLRMVLWAAVERYGHKWFSGDILSHVTDECVVSQILSTYGPGHARHITHFVIQTPNCWPRLQKLIHRDTIPVTSHVPELLELAGIVVRKDGFLEFASPIAKKVTEQSFTDRSFADLYARNGQWNKAFEYYQMLNSEERVRPESMDDINNVDTLVKGLSSALYEAASEAATKDEDTTRRSEVVKKLFINGCRFLLGYSEVTFWTKIRGIWKCTTSSSDFENQVTNLESILDLLPHQTAIERTPPTDLDPNTIAVGIPEIREDEPSLVVVGKFKDSAINSGERRRVTKNLAAHFQTAYSSAIEIEKNKQRLDVREQFSSIVKSLFVALGTKVTNVKEALEITASGLRKLGYRRVLFCLVDPTEKRIKGVLDNSDDSSVNVAEMTDWAINDVREDVQPWVVYSGKSLIVEDATKEKLINKDVITKAKMKSLAVIPLNHPDNYVVGTVHVERTDGKTPTNTQVKDLERFGTEIAVAIEQAARIRMQEAALDKQTEPIVILDRIGRCRYANEPAKKFLKLKSGWQNRSYAEKYTAVNIGSDAFEREGYKGIIQKGLEYLEETKNGSRSFLQAPFKADLLHHHIEIMHDGIFNKQHECMGVVCHLQDLSFPYRAFEALKLIQSANTPDEIALQALEAMRVMGHTWGRLYRHVEEEGNDKFISEESFGLAPEISEKFRKKHYSLESHQEPGSEAFLSVNQRRPIVFCRNESLPDGEEFKTHLGLKARNVLSNNCPAEFRKQNGDFWIDLPLVTEDSIVGKLTIQCHEDFPPEHWAFIDTLGSKICEYMALSIERENVRKKRWIQEAAESAIRDISHHIRTRIAALPLYCDEYKVLTEALKRDKKDNVSTDLNNLNEKFETFCNRIGSYIEGIHNKLTPDAELVRSGMENHPDIVELVEASLRAVLPNKKNWDLEVSLNDTQIEINPSLFDLALTELVSNAKQCCKIPEDLKLKVKISQYSLNGSTENSWIRFEITDNGPGIPPTDKERIFENFFSQRSGNCKGTGLGLGLVRKIIVAHSGSISETGTPPEGARFLIELPRHHTLGSLQNVK